MSRLQPGRLAAAALGARSPGMRRAILHIGVPRTGTTSLQKLLAERRAALLGVGVLFPDLTPRSAERPHLSHQHLGEALDGRRPPEERRELLEDLDRQLAETPADVAILSYERLWRAASWRRLPRMLCDLAERRGFRPEVLVTVRGQAELIQSHYGWRLQFLREWRPFAEAFSRDLGDRRLDFAAGVAPWSRAAEGRVSAVPLRDEASAEPMALRVATELGLADRLQPILAEPAARMQENRSPGPVTSEVSRRIRWSGVRLRAAEGRRLIDQAARLAASRPEEAAPFRALTPAQAARAQRRFAASNAAFAAAVWGEPWEARVASPPLHEPNELAGRRLAADLELAIERICETLAEGAPSPRAAVLRPA